MVSPKLNQKFSNKVFFSKKKYRWRGCLKQRNAHRSRFNYENAAQRAFEQKLMEREYVAEYLLKMAGTMPCRTHKAYYDTLKTPWEQYIKRNLKQIFLGGEKRKRTEREGGTMPFPLYYFRKKRGEKTVLIIILPWAIGRRLKDHSREKMTFLFRQSWRRWLK